MLEMIRQTQEVAPIRAVASFPTAAFWRAYIVTMRPYLIFVSGAAGLVGLAFIESTASFRLAAGFLPLFLSYGFGQALTDCFQTDTDSLSAPYRPLVRGIISRREVLAVSLSGLLGGMGILAGLNPACLFPGGLAVLGLLSYTFFKRRWWGGPFWNSWIVALLPVMGRLVEKEADPLRFISGSDTEGPAFVASILAVFFGYANFVIMGYFKDISADRSTGYRTLPVVFGWRAAAVWSDTVAVLFFAAATAAVVLSGQAIVLGAACLLAAAGLNLAAQAGIHRTRSETSAHRPIVNVVRSFILGCLAVVLTRKPGWLAIAAVFYLVFEATLSLRPEKRQV